MECLRVSVLGAVQVGSPVITQGLCSLKVSLLCSARSVSLAALSCDKFCFCLLLTLLPGATCV